MQKRVLFILKQRPLGEYGAWNYSNYGKGSSGLYVSAKQVVEGLHELGIAAESVVVVDNNQIDREVTRFQPTHVIIEAFWVVPEKFDVLQKLHPNVQWVVRNHSKTDFLANEGSAIGWALDYLKRNVIVACNSVEATVDFKSLARSQGLPTSLVTYLPNYYANLSMPFEFPHPWLVTFMKFLRAFKIGKSMDKCRFYGELHIGCFGAIRPLKNHLNQALAAIEAADELGLQLFFHINSNRVEGQGEPALKNMRAIFDRHPTHMLIEHAWMEHADFVDLISEMDMVMQVSISETFNIVAADAVASGVPVLVSHEIPWLDSEYKVPANDVNKIAKGILHVLRFAYNGRPWVQYDQFKQLVEYTHKSLRSWDHFLNPMSNQERLEHPLS